MFNSQHIYSFGQIQTRRSAPYEVSVLWSVRSSPERDPGDDHDENGWNVWLDHVEAERPGKLELGHEAAVIAWKVISTLVSFLEK